MRAAVRLANFQTPPASAPVVADEGARAKALLDRVIAAKGGLATLQGIKSLKAITVARMVNQPDPSGKSSDHSDDNAETTTYLQYPDHARIETKAPQGTQIQIYDGAHGWVRDPGGVYDVPQNGLRDMAASLKRDTVAALVAASRGELRPRILPDVKDAAGKISHALELSSPTLDPLVLYIDPQTNLITKQAYVARAPEQPLIEELFSDYRLVDGVNVAFTAEARADGKPIVTRTIKEITFNAPLDPGLFKRPGS